MSFLVLIGIFKKLYIKGHRHSPLESLSYGEVSFIWVKDFYENPWEFYGWIFNKVCFWIGVWRQIV